MPPCMEETDEGSLTWITFGRAAECDSVHTVTVELFILGEPGLQLWRLQVAQEVQCSVGRFCEFHNASRFLLLLISL